MDESAGPQRAGGAALAIALLGTGGVGGWFAGGAGGALLGAVAGVIAIAAVRKQAIVATVRGARLGVFFALCVGPIADYFMSRLAFQRESVVKAVVIGSLVGGALGVRNARRPKKDQSPSS